MSLGSRLSATLAAICLLGGCGHAALTEGVAPDPGFIALDTNGDGRLSLEESRLPQLAFQALDRNGDAALDILEWQAGEADASTAAMLQQAVTDQRDLRNLHRNGSTTRGAD